MSTDSELISVPDAAPRDGNAITRGFGRALLRLCGWRLEGELPDRTHALFIVAPHTSNMDWVVGVAAFLASGLRVSYLAKHSLFVGPLGWLMRKTGGIAVDRGQPAGIADAVALRFHQETKLWLALTPEGTRKQVSRWKTGFLRIAYAASVPVVPVWLDNESRRLVVHQPLQLEGDIDADLARVLDHYRRLGVDVAK